MKKNNNRKKRSKIPKKNTPEKNIQIPQQTPEAPRERMHRPLLTACKVVFGFLITAAGLVLGVTNFLGPPWPTEPIFSPGAPSFGFPFDVPFSVSNKSSISWIRRAKFACRAEWWATNNSSFVGAPAIQVTTSNETLAPMSAAPYVCPMFIRPEEPARITRANLKFEVQYDSRWPWGDRVTMLSDDFVLNTATTPPQWSVGKPLR